MSGERNSEEEEQEEEEEEGIGERKERGPWEGEGKEEDDKEGDLETGSGIEALGKGGAERWWWRMEVESVARDQDINGDDGW